MSKQKELMNKYKNVIIEKKNWIVATKFWMATKTHQVTFSAVPSPIDVFIENSVINIFH